MSYRFAIFLACLMVPGVPASASLLSSVTATVTPADSTNLLYSYSISNSANSTTNIFQFTLSDILSSIVSNASAPAGWDVTIDPDSSSVQWTSSDTPYDLVPGATQNGFTLTSNYLPLSDSYLLESYDPVTYVGEFGSGTTSIPGSAVVTASAVPEPGTLFPALAAVLLFPWIKRRTRKPFTNV